MIMLEINECRKVHIYYLSDIHDFFVTLLSCEDLKLSLKLKYMQLLFLLYLEVTNEFWDSQLGKK